jgi:hypothetical protein
MAHAHDWGRHLRRANRIDVCHLLQAQPNVRASETLVRVIPETDDATAPFRLKSSIVSLSNSCGRIACCKRINKVAAAILH